MSHAQALSSAKPFAPSLPSVPSAASALWQRMVLALVALGKDAPPSKMANAYAYAYGAKSVPSPALR